MSIPPSAKETKAAAGKKGLEAIPFPDLRAVGQREYQKQKELCQHYTCDTLTAANEIEAARVRGRDCFQQRIKVRTIFKDAIGRVKAVLAQMKSGDPLKPDMERILHELEASQKGHETAITEVNNAVLKCDEKLKRLKT